MEADFHRARMKWRTAIACRRLKEPVLRHHPTARKKGRHSGPQTRSSAHPDSRPASYSKRPSRRRSAASKGLGAGRRPIYPKCLRIEAEMPDGFRPERNAGTDRAWAWALSLSIRRPQVHLRTRRRVEWSAWRRDYPHHCGRGAGAPGGGVPTLRRVYPRWGIPVSCGLIAVSRISMPSPCVPSVFPMEARREIRRLNFGPECG